MYNAIDEETVPDANIQQIIIKNGMLLPGSILWILKLCCYLSDHG